MRRKEFWPLPRADKLLNKFIPNLSHEADGLIFQREHAAQRSTHAPPCSTPPRAAFPPRRPPVRPRPGASPLTGL